MSEVPLPVRTKSDLRVKRGGVSSANGGGSEGSESGKDADQEGKPPQFLNNSARESGRFPCVS